MVVNTKGEIGAIVPSKNNLVGYPLAVIAIGRGRLRHKYLF